MLARELHWTRAELLSMDHAERRRWVLEITRQDHVDFDLG